MRVVESLNTTLAELMEADRDLRLLGEDVLDPYGGAFKVMRGLSARFPDRVLTTPISEACIVGVATGLALRGKPTIVEIMFGDFLCLAMDQLLNHASKLAWLYDDQVSIPLILRTPMGGGRGYGATHSQSLEKHFCGMPGLTVFAIHPFEPPGGVLRAAYRRGAPTLIIENKTMYAQPVATPGDLPHPAAPDLAIITYGGCVEPAVRAAVRLRQDEEILAEVVPITQLSPFPSATVQATGARCPRILVVEEGAEGWGFAAECAHALIGSAVRFASLAAPPHPIPNSRSWELAILPSADSIAHAAIALFARD
jgi:acetoin:2,6-dichlorophenolindophenol oxidoreductase subunit beta